MLLGAEAQTQDCSLREEYISHWNIDAAYFTILLTPQNLQSFSPSSPSSPEEVDGNILLRLFYGLSVRVPIWVVDNVGLNYTQMEEIFENKSPFTMLVF